MLENNATGIKRHKEREINYFQFVVNLSGGLSDTTSYPLIKINMNDPFK